MDGEWGLFFEASVLGESLSIISFMSNKWWAGIAGKLSIFTQVALMTCMG